jgi:hypothetical protein
MLDIILYLCYNITDMTIKSKTLIGRAEKVRFPELGNTNLHARIDTGAKTSSIWASKATETPSGLAVSFASPDHEIHAHEAVFKHYDKVSWRHLR